MRESQFFISSHVRLRQNDVDKFKSCIFFISREDTMIKNMAKIFSKLDYGVRKDLFSD